MAKKGEYYSYIHTDSSVKDLNELLNGASNPTSITRGFELGNLLRYEDEKGITNLEKIWDKYPFILKNQELENKFNQNLSYLKQYSSDLETKIETPKPNGFLDKLYPNTILSIPLKKLNRDTLIGEGNQIVDQEYEAFIADKLKELQLDQKYFPLYKTDLGNLGNLKIQFPNLTVWLWCRSLTKSETTDSEVDINPLTFSNSVDDLGNPFSQNGNYKKVTLNNEPLSGTIIDLSPFIDFISISNGPNGGSFNFTLPPVIGEYDNELGWKIKSNSLKTYSYNSEMNYYSEGNYEKNQGLINDFYFHNIIGENDLIFIRLETLNNEAKERVKDKSFSNPLTNFEVPREELAGKIYDMIGLVDTSPISHNPEINKVQISVSGRDLVKLLIEDSSIFTPLNFIPKGSYFSSEPDSRLLNRIEGKLHTLTQVAEKSIEFSLKYVMNSLSGMGVVPSDLFNSYIKKTLEGENSNITDERSYKFRLDSNSKKENQNRIKDLNERVKNIKDKIGKVRESEKLIEPYLSSEISLTFNSLYDFIKTGYSEKKLNPKEQNIITGWERFKFRGYNIEKDYLPALFNYHFISPNKYWTDENGKKITLADKEAIINEWEDVAKELQKEKERVGDYGNISQDEVPPLVMTNRDYLDIKNTSLNEMLKKSYEELNNQREVNIKRGQDRLSAKNYQKDPKLIELQKIEDNKKVARIEALRAQNEALAKKYNGFKAIFHEEPRKYNSLNSIAKEVLNDILEYVILNNKEEEQDQYNLELCDGVYQIVKLVIDDEIKDKRLVDNSIGNESGSILNYFRKVCQEPFVELFTDTYKDQFYIIARKPPFTQNKIQNHIDNGLITNIEKGDIISGPNFSFNQGLGYSMYRVTPQSAFLGGSDSITWAYLKAIYFPEFADIFGLKFLDQISQYIPHYPLIKEGTDRGSSYAIEQSIKDLKFLIETNMYLPFSREGSISIIGDRRFKRGTWIRILETEEIGYIESISHSLVRSTSLSRTTTLNLTRVLKEKYLNKYFQLINLDIKEDINKNDSYEDWITNVIGNWKVNKEILNFFLRREQLK